MDHSNCYAASNADSLNSNDYRVVSDGKFSNSLSQRLTVIHRLFIVVFRADLAFLVCGFHKDSCGQKCAGVLYMCQCIALAVCEAFLKQSHKVSRWFIREFWGEQFFVVSAPSVPFLRSCKSTSVHPRKHVLYCDARIVELLLKEWRCCAHCRSLSHDAFTFELYFNLLLSIIL